MFGANMPSFNDPDYAMTEKREREPQMNPVKVAMFLKNAQARIEE